MATSWQIAAFASRCGRDRARFAAVYGDGSDALPISLDDEQYITNFHPPAGDHTYTVKMFFNGYLQDSTTFTAK